jgi:cobalt-zinc-cadmium efflux system outer membrane protein
MWNTVAFKTGACIVILFFSTGANAEPRSANSQKTISLNQAVGYTVERNPELISLGYQIQIREGLLVQAGLAPNPELSVSVEDVFGTGDFNSVDSAQTTVSLGWILEHGVRQRRVDVARANVSLATTDAEIVRVDKAADTARQFLACLANQTRLVNSNEAVALAKDIVKAVQVRVNASKAPRAELARAKADLALKELELGDVKHDLMSSYRRLAAQWGETKPNFEQVAGNLLRLPETESFDTLKGRLDQNSEFTRLISQRRLNETELHLAQALSKPQWRVSAGVRRFEREDDQALVLGFTVPLALRNRNQGQIAASRAKLSKIDADTKVVDVRIKTQLFALYEELQHSIHRATTLQNVVIPAIEQALSDSRDAYQRGRFSFLEWQVVQADLLDANKKLINATSNAHLYVIEIERLTGEKIVYLSRSLREKS